MRAPYGLANRSVFPHRERLGKRSDLSESAATTPVLHADATVPHAPGTAPRPDAAAHASLAMEGKEPRLALATDHHKSSMCGRPNVERAIPMGPGDCPAPPAKRVYRATKGRKLRKSSASLLSVNLAVTTLSESITTRIDSALPDTSPDQPANS